MWDRLSLLSVDQISREDAEEIISLSSRMKASDSCRGKILANIFFEPSTRTEKSFQSAMYRLGGQVITHRDIGSSREKGETKDDTIRVLASYADIAVIRDDEKGRMKEYSDMAGIPIINGGDGSNEHPTQTLLDMFTIKDEIGRLDNLKVVFIGDLKYSRSIHTIMKMLSKFSGNKLYTISPHELMLPEGMREIQAESYFIEQMKDALKRIQPEVIYCNRIQKERLQGEKGSYVIDNGILQILPGSSIIMNPLPRAGELSIEIDSDKRFVAFKQAGNGVAVRMALLSMMLKTQSET